MQAAPDLALGRRERRAARWLAFGSGRKVRAPRARRRSRPRDTTAISWTALYKAGELVVARGRKRLYWELGNRAVSGVTGITGTGVTVADPLLDELGLRAVEAVDPPPEGIFAVDFTYDREGVPNPTEINIGRFFTTHLFFTRAGLKLPYLFVKLAFDEPYPAPARRFNPLPSGLAWVRGVDFLPVLTELAAFEQAERELVARRRRLPPERHGP